MERASVLRQYLGHQDYQWGRRTLRNGDGRRNHRGWLLKLQGRGALQLLLQLLLLVRDKLQVPRGQPLMLSSDQIVGV